MPVVRAQLGGGRNEGQAGLLLKHFEKNRAAQRKCASPPISTSMSWIQELPDSCQSSAQLPALEIRKERAMDSTRNSLVPLRLNAGLIPSTS